MATDQSQLNSTVWQRLPARTIILALALFWASFWVVHTLGKLGDIFTFVVIATFFAILLTPLVNFCVRRLHLSRGWAALSVFLVGLVCLSGILYLFIKPIADHVPEFAKEFPAYVDNVKHCAKSSPHRELCPKGPISDVIRKFKLEKRLDQFGNETAKAVQAVKKNASTIASTVGRGVTGTLTIFLLVVLMLLHGSIILNRFISPLKLETQERLRRLGRDSAHAVTSYMFGNVLISVIAGIITFVSLAVFGVKFKGALALWVGIADLIPLVGATIGAIPTVLIAFLHSTTAGIGMIIVFVVYQQFENHVIQVAIMSRTVQLEPLVVIFSVLIGVQLWGMLGALLAIPVAGAIQVVIRDLLSDNQNMQAGRPQPPPPPERVANSVDEKA